jgi:hypothetical protein
MNGVSEMESGSSSFSDLIINNSLPSTTTTTTTSPSSGKIFIIENEEEWNEKYKKEEGIALISLDEKYQLKVKEGEGILGLGGLGGGGLVKNNSFCEEWALELRKYRKDPLKLRSIIEIFKVKIIQDLNHLKLFVEKAKIEFYSLYKAHHFLKKNANADILLSLLLQDPNLKNDPNILLVLKTCISSPSSNSNPSPPLSDSLLE